MYFYIAFILSDAFYGTPLNFDPEASASHSPDPGLGPYYISPCTLFLYA